MRFYDYKCSACGQIDEYYEQTDFKDERTCSQCGSPMLRMITAVQFNFQPSLKDIKHSERRKMWNSKDPKDKRELTF